MLFKKHFRSKYLKALKNVEPIYGIVFQSHQILMVFIRNIQYFCSLSVIQLKGSDIYFQLWVDFCCEMYFPNILSEFIERSEDLMIFFGQFDDDFSVSKY